jgi:hexosaminidase
MKVRIALYLLSIFIVFPLFSQILLPFPKSYRFDKGIFQITSATEIKGTNDYATTLADELSDQLKDISPMRDSSRNKIVLNFIENPDSPENEEYSLEVKRDTILLQASSESRLFHAKETLLQMARSKQGKVSYCRIQDAPRFQWRGFMLDESRHFLGKEKVKQYLDIMASLRLNVFHWHLTNEQGWRIEIKKYPKLAQIGAAGNWHDPNAAPQFYTQDHIKEIIAYAAHRHIMVVPEIDMPRHATAACKAYPEYSGGGEGGWKGFTFNPAKEETYQFLSDIFDEIIQLFRNGYLHF